MKMKHIKNGTFITLIIIFGSFGSVQFSSVQLAWIIDAGWFFGFECSCIVRMHIIVFVYRRMELEPWAQADEQ